MENGGTPTKRSLDSSDGAPSPSPKKAKFEESPGKKDSSFSSLMKKVAIPSSPVSAAEAARLRAQERDAKLIAKLAPVANTEVSSTDSSSTKDINSEGKNREEFLLQSEFCLYCFLLLTSLPSLQLYYLCLAGNAIKNLPRRKKNT